MAAKSKRTPTKVREKIPAELILAARQWYVFVIQDADFVAKQFGLDRDVVRHLAQRLGWDREAAEARAALADDDKKFRDDLEKQKREVNSNAFSAALAVLIFHRIAAGRLSADAATVPEPVLLDRMRRSPKLGEAVTAARTVTGQVTEKIETDNKISDLWDRWKELTDYAESGAGGSGGDNDVPPASAPGATQADKKS